MARLSVHDLLSAVFEERQTIFLCIAFTVKPGVPFSTMMQLISFLPPSRFPVAH